MADQSEEAVLEMEASVETARYRQDRMRRWKTLRAAYDGYIEDAKKHGATHTTAEAAAAKYQRGAVRALVSELLTRAPVSAIIPFLAATRALDDPTALFQKEEAVVELINSVYPKATWATKIEKLADDVAADDASWSVWAARWAKEFGTTSEAALDAIVDAGRTTAQFDLGAAELTATLIRWSPYILGGVVVLGVVVAARK